MAIEKIKNCRAEQFLRIVVRAAGVIFHGLERRGLRDLVDKEFVVVRVEYFGGWPPGFNQTNL
jgi:hypothetical protein